MRVAGGLFRGAGLVAVIAGGSGHGVGGIGRGRRVLVVAQVARGTSGLVLAIGGNRPPAKLECESDKQQVDEAADHAEQYNIVARFALSCRP